MHPAYDEMFDAFAPENTKGKPVAPGLAVEQMKLAAKASQNLGLNAHASFSGALWYTMYPWPQRPAGLVKLALKNWLIVGFLF